MYHYMENFGRKLNPIIAEDIVGDTVFEQRIVDNNIDHVDICARATRDGNGDDDDDGNKDSGKDSGC